ncbi:uncharacterized protein LOC135218087 [Macrobrachium nipponense]|uniref:uncharacterized protein LOC135218087 n=1 Tax=Macrobrachium nipponense TaxID=159736 RepID=UPI0030C7AFC4
MLGAFKSSPDDVIHKISSHKSLNHSKDIIYCKDLCEFSKEEILKRCPPTVINVKKFKGVNKAILLTFSTSYLPDYIQRKHLNINIKKYNPRPTQCFNCFNYGHINEHCTNKTRCFNCSELHEFDHQCLEDTFCLHCTGPHSPNSRQCPIYKQENAIIITANDEHISFGTARRNLFGSNPNTRLFYSNAASRSFAAKKTSMNDLANSSLIMKTNKNMPLSDSDRKTLTPETRDPIQTKSHSAKKPPTQLDNQSTLTTTNPFEVLNDETDQTIDVEMEEVKRSKNFKSGGNTSNDVELEAELLIDFNAEGRKRKRDSEIPLKSQK